MNGFGHHRAATAAEFQALTATVESVIDRTARLPRLPFAATCGHIAVAQFTRLPGSEFVPVFDALAGASGDGSVVVVAIEPPPSVFAANVEFFPGFTVATPDLNLGYWEGLNFSPTDDPTVEMLEMSDVLAVVGSSRRWAVWGDRGWDIALVWAAEGDDWLDVGVPFVSAREAVEDFSGYGSWGTLLDPDEVEAFIGNVDSWASAPGRDVC